MNIKNTFLLIVVFAFTFLPEFLFAQDIFDEGPDPPPSAPIDIYLVFLVLIGVVYAAYKYYKSDNLPRKRDKKHTSQFKNQLH